VKDEKITLSHKMQIINFDGTLDDSPKKILSFKEFDSNDLSLADSKIIVAAGMGAGGPAGIKIIKDFAESIGAAVGASRSVIDSGWLDYSHQIGQTGITVHPEIYIACGISGAVQHLAGMQNADFIIAINKDPNAPVFGIADVGITGDIFEVIPMLTEKFSRKICIS
jgi:electron transfer flavoprotein alpha subunit